MWLEFYIVFAADSQLPIAELNQIYLNRVDNKYIRLNNNDPL